jgi:hypothetical protein
VSNRLVRKRDDQTTLHDFCALQVFGTNRHLHARQTIFNLKNRYAEKVQIWIYALLAITYFF